MRKITDGSYETSSIKFTPFVVGVAAFSLARPNKRPRNIAKLPPARRIPT
jgi:hypothetical protein